MTVKRIAINQESLGYFEEDIKKGLKKLNLFLDEFNTKNHSAEYLRQFVKIKIKDIFGEELAGEKLI